MDETNAQRERFDHGLFRIAARGGLVQGGEEEFGLAAHYLFEEVVFGGKAPVDGAAADSGARGDVFDVRAPHPVGLEDRSRGVQDGAVELGDRLEAGSGHWPHRNRTTS